MNLALAFLVSILRKLCLSLEGGIVLSVTTLNFDIMAGNQDHERSFAQH
jgi:hypothetical protein